MAWHVLKDCMYSLLFERKKAPMIPSRKTPSPVVSLESQDMLVCHPGLMRRRAGLTRSRDEKNLTVGSRIRCVLTHGGINMAQWASLMKTEKSSNKDQASETRDEE